MEAQIVALFISPGHDFKGRHGKGRMEHDIQSVDAVECVAGRGIKGDRYFEKEADHKGQITFFDEAVYHRVQADFDLPDLAPTAFRRNVLTRGVDLNDWIGKQFTIQGITFEGVEECAPCYWMDEAAAPGVFDALKGHGGLRGRIVSSGTLSTDGVAKAGA